jgi:transposase
MAQSSVTTCSATAHQEFIRFLNTVEARVPKRKTIHAIVDNYAAYKHPTVQAWLARHSRWTFHFTPTSASWPNAVEGSLSTAPKPVPIQNRSS